MGKRRGRHVNIPYVELMPAHGRIGYVREQV